MDLRSFALGALLVVLVAALFLWGCGGVKAPGSSADRGDSTPAGAPTPTPAESPPKESLNLGKTRVTSLKGHPWRMDASGIQWVEAQKGGQADQVHWQLLGDGGEVAVDVTAAGASFDMEVEQVEFVGKVLALRPDSGDQLIVNHLVWRGKEKKFYGSQGVRWKRGKYQMQGESLVSDATFTRVQVTGGVHGLTLLKGELP